MTTAIIAPTEAAAGNAPADCLIITPRTLDRLRGVSLTDVSFPRIADEIPYTQAYRIYEAVEPSLDVLPYDDRATLHRALIRWLGRVVDDREPAKPAAPATEALTAGQLTSAHLGATIDLTLDNGARVVDRLKSVSHWSPRPSIADEFRTRIELQHLVSRHGEGDYVVDAGARVVIIERPEVTA